MGQKSCENCCSTEGVDFTLSYLPIKILDTPLIYKEQTSLTKVLDARILLLYEHRIGYYKNKSKYEPNIYKLYMYLVQKWSTHNPTTTKGLITAVVE